MFREQDFKKVQKLGSGKKNTTIFMAQHIQTGQIYAIKEVEAKTIDKLNEYKEEAVQLSKVTKIHSNIVQFFGYYFSQTDYNTFILSLITEFLDHRQNMEYMYRKKKKNTQRFQENDLVKILFTMISTCSSLQQHGICHRDIKPANIFVQQPSGEIKLIDFGESKDYFYDPEDENAESLKEATIRGTPQYLSPILWQAHVVDGKSRFVVHNIYKSDVFSCGLVICQLAMMEEVTGFNNTTQENNGQVKIKEALMKLETIYGNQFVNIIALMLIFDEQSRPSFVEIEQLFIEHEQQEADQKKQKKKNEYVKLYNTQFNTLLKKSKYNESKFKSKKLENSLLSPNPSSSIQQSLKKEEQNKNSGNNGNNTQLKEITSNVQSNSNFMKPEKIEHIYKETTLVLHEDCFWFEFGGNQVGKFSIHKQRWKIKQYTDENHQFPYHMIAMYIPDQRSYYLLGGPQKQNFRIYKNGVITMAKQQLPYPKDFFATAYYSQKVFCFGGYDSSTKQQLNTCEYYDIIKDKWTTIAKMNYNRSQASACRITNNEILVFGGYNKEQGILSSIERYLIKQNKFEVLDIKIPIPLRRFKVARVAENIALILGGLTAMSKESQNVYKFDYAKNEMITMENLEKGGVIESEVLVDHSNFLHLFLEHSNGTSPPSHIKYYFDPKAQQYVTKMIDDF